MTNPAKPSLLVSIDRIEKSTAVAEGDDGRTFEVPIKTFTGRPREGMIYRVPLDGRGEPIWTEAVADSAAEAARKADLEARMYWLRRKDPGGDIKL